MLGTAPAEVVPVRLDPNLKQAVEARAEAEHTTTSEIIREALRRFLEVATSRRGELALPHWSCSRHRSRPSDTGDTDTKIRGRLDHLLVRVVDRV